MYMVARVRYLKRYIFNISALPRNRKFFTLLALSTGIKLPFLSGPRTGRAGKERPQFHLHPSADDHRYLQILGRKEKEKMP